MERKKEALSLIESIVGNKAVADSILERLQDEGFLHLGYGKAEVDQIVGTFKETFGNTKTTKWDRASANRLAEAHSVKAVVYIIKALKASENDKYVPSVGSVQQLEDKWVNVLAFVRKQHNRNGVVEL
jgi:hypothetical protein